MGLADGADAAVDVLERDVPLGGAVHLDDPGDAEALLKRGPDVGPEPGAGGHAQAMGPIEGRGRLTQEVPTELADVDEGDGLVAPHVVEKGAGRELPARREGAPCPEGRGETHEQTLPVVQ